MNRKCFIYILLFFILMMENLYPQNFIFPRFDISTGISLGALLSGGQKRINDSILEPDPETYLNFHMHAGIHYFHFSFLGLEAGISFLGSTTAYHHNITDLSIFEYVLIHGGCIIQIPLITHITGISLCLGGGITCGFLWFTSDFRDFAGVALSYITSDFGFYLKGGGRYYVTEKFYLQVMVQYININGIIEANGNRFDGYYLQLQISVGFGLF